MGTENDGTGSNPDWVPDLQTISWCFGAAYAPGVMEAIRDDTRDRYLGKNPEFAWSPDDNRFWAVVSEAAEEALLLQLRRSAIEAQRHSQ